MQNGEPTVDLREVVNALRFKTLIIGGWSMLPTEFGSRDVIHWWFRRFLRLLLLRIVYDVEAMVREVGADRTKVPPATQQFARRGVGAVVIDRHGRLHLDSLTVADITRKSGSQALLDAIITRWPWVKHLLCDGPFDREALVSKPVLLEFIHEVACRVAAEPVRESSTQQADANRNSGWLMRWRSFLRLYEARLDISDAPAWPWETY